MLPVAEDPLFMESVVISTQPVPSSDKVASLQLAVTQAEVASVVNAERPLLNAVVNKHRIRKLNFFIVRLSYRPMFWAGD
jgi:hypothetical protein